MILALIMMIGLIVALVAVFTTISPPERGLWVAVGGDGTNGGYGNIMYSTDGKKWEETKSGASFSGPGSLGYGVAYGNGRWVAVGHDGSNGGYGNIMHSADGKVWEVSSDKGASFSGGDSGGSGVAYGNGRWVAVGYDLPNRGYGSIMHSADGKVWTESSSDGASFSGAASEGSGVAYGKDKWVAVGTNSAPTLFGNILWSNDGMCWVISGMGSDQGDEFGINGNGVAYSSKQDLWVAVGNDGGTDYYGNIMWSTNGMCWVDSSDGDSFSGSGSMGIGIAYSSKQDLWVAVGTDGGGGYGNIMWSDNGTCWVKTNEGASFLMTGEGQRVAYSSVQDLWVAVGRDGGTGGYRNIMYSKDGKVWEVSSDKGASFSSYGYGVAFGGV